MSGLPLNDTDVTTFKAEFNKRMDELKEQHGEPNEENMKLFQDELLKLEDEQLSKYPRSMDVELADIPSLINQFKQAIVLTLDNTDDPNSVSAYIMDVHGE